MQISSEKRRVTTNHCEKMMMKCKQGVNIVFRGVPCPKFDTPQSSGVVALPAALRDVTLKRKHTVTFINAKNGCAASCLQIEAVFRMPFLRLLILLYEAPKTGLHACKVKKHTRFLKKIDFVLPHFYMIRELLVQSSSKNQSL